MEQRRTIDIDFESVRRNRELTDQRVREGFLASTQKKPAATLPPGPPVTIRELAQRLKMDVSSCRRYVLSLGYTPIKQRTATSSFQPALTLTPAEADAIYQRRHAEGYC
jgi:hypothetical protein